MPPCLVAGILFDLDLWCVHVRQGKAGCFPLPLSTLFCVYMIQVCLYVCTYTTMHVWRSGQNTGCCSSPSTLLETGSLFTALYARLPSRDSVPTLGYRQVLPCLTLHGFWGFNSGPYACALFTEPSPQFLHLIYL